MSETYQVERYRQTPMPQNKYAHAYREHLLIVIEALIKLAILSTQNNCKCYVYKCLNSTLLLIQYKSMKKFLIANDKAYIIYTNY